MTPEEKKLRAAEHARRWRQKHPEAYQEAKRKYNASESGKASKKRADASYALSGGRAKSEERRAQKPVSEPRKQARLKYQLMRRSNEKALDELDAFVLQEAVSLARLRGKTCSGDWHIDHIIPVSRGGKSSYDNIQVVPALWNRSKSNHHSKRYFACATGEPHG